MGIDRRDFLKGIGGVCAVAGLGVAGSLTLEKKTEASSGGQKEAPSALRWGMAINIAKFDDSLISKCSKACHAIHNVPKFDGIKEEIKWIWGEKFPNTFPSKSHQFLFEGVEDKSVPVLCNHCKNPPCVRVCPTKATFKREDGIILMDFHRCIGCRFCMAACPYGSRSFNWRNPRVDAKTLVGGAKITKTFPTRERGVVEKCNFCAERIAKGTSPKPGHELERDQTPMCVLESRGAIVFGNLNDPDSKVREVLKQNHTIQRKSESGTNPSVFYIV